MHRLAMTWAGPTVVFACLAFAAPVAAQSAPPVPRLVTISGALPGMQGRVDLVFALYADQASDTPLWTETQGVTVDADGRYAVHLGASRPDGLPAELFASGEARWLGVRAEGRAEQPRVLLVSVPYALKAADAETIGGKPLSAFVLAGDATGVGPDGLNYVDTRVLRQGLSTAGPPPQGAGTPGYIGKFSTATELDNSALYQAATWIGVNTTAPMAAFHAVAQAAPGALFDVYSDSLGALPVVNRAARGTPWAPSAVQTDDILGGLAVRGYGATGFTAGRGQVMFRAAENWTDSANGTYLEFTTTPIGGSGWIERMRITPAGQVGIGTATPGQMLSVTGTIESTTGGFRFPDGTTQVTAAKSLGTNVAFGTQSLAANTTGSSNAAFGYSALMANTTGNANHAFGYRSLDANTTGSSNHAFGYNSLGANTTGFNNNAFGMSSLGSNMTGANNNAFGTSALAATAEAFANNAFGGSALGATTTGIQNAAFGHWSLGANTIGTGNSAFGHNGLFSNTIGTLNAALGSMSLFGTTTGNYNTGVGAWAGHELTTGSYNTFVGYQAGPDASSPAISYATAIGANALVTLSNTLVLGGVLGSGSEVNVGIGTTTPDKRLQVLGDVRIGASGRFGCLLNFDGSQTWGICPSDIRFKKDIAPFAPVLDRIVQLRPVRFTWRGEAFPERHLGNARASGLVAQEVEPAFPELVTTDDQGYKMVNYAELPLVMLAAMKELKARGDRLEAENDALKAQLAALAARLARLEKAEKPRDDSRQR